MWLAQTLDQMGMMGFEESSRKKVTGLRSGFMFSGPCRDLFSCSFVVWVGSLVYFCFETGSNSVALFSQVLRL